MPVYINMLEDDQRKLIIINLPLSNATILAMETIAVFALQDYLYKSREWERDPKAAKTWAVWKLRYKRAYEQGKLAHQALYRAG